MKNPNNALALIVAYFLSKYDEWAYQELALASNYSKTHQEIARILGVKSSNVKNMRDEFDPLHPNHRVGWYQKPLAPTRRVVVEKFQDLSREELRDYVREILLCSEKKNIPGAIKEIANEVLSDKTSNKDIVFYPRDITGQKAEKYFIAFFEDTKQPQPGKLIDKRNDGCGYDFEILSGTKSYQIEVKGLDGIGGGISFTSKEWDVANNRGESYYLAIVRNISGSPKIQFIQNPAVTYSPRRHLSTVVQIRWNLTEKDLASVPSAN